MTMTLPTQTHADADSHNGADHAVFLAVMPLICSLARRRFRFLPTDQREEAVAEAVAYGFLMYRSLVQRGRAACVQTTGFARNAVRAVAGGRRAGSAQAGRDVLSGLGRRRHGRAVHSLDSAAADEPDAPNGNWLHQAVADRRTSVPDKVALRIDGGRWFAGLPEPHRQMVRALATGEKACVVAKTFGITPGRLSQLRRAWSEQWQHEVGVAA